MLYKIITSQELINKNFDMIRCERLDGDNDTM